MQFDRERQIIPIKNESMLMSLALNADEVVSLVKDNDIIDFLKKFFNNIKIADGVILSDDDVVLVVSKKNGKVNVAIAR